MATDIDILFPRTSTELKQSKVSFTSQHMAFQAANQCSATCPTCRNSCELLAGHQGNHQCSNGHQWAARPGDAPGPH